jgi:septal ring factor EnvC (AmiA/AmiB activator)
MTPGPQPSPQQDALSNLENRIVEAVQLVGRLRRERDEALAQAADARVESGRLADELAALAAERKQVRTRIEKLLEQIEQLSGT